MSMPRKIRCAVAAITDHGDRVYTLDLTPDLPVPAFRPGQFLHLTVEDFDPGGFWPESRVFSIASSPRERRHLRVCYSVKGRYTARMEATLKVGGAVWVKLPYGEFEIDGSQEAMLLAGGTGISAFTAFLEALEPAGTQRVWLLYGARTPTLFLFTDLLLRQLDRVPGFQTHFFTETAAAGFAERLAAHSRPPALRAGRIDLDPVWPQIGSAAAVNFYLSGPPAMLRSLGADLRARGVGSARIRTDAWE